jgi:flagellar protein FlbD
VIKLTRINQQTIAINPDVVLWAEASPDTVLCMTGGEKVLVRESIDELIDKVIEFRRRVAREFPMGRADYEK